VTKREQKRGRAPDAVFDPQAHRDWVSGFGKRKKQRREEALRALAVRARRDRVEQRKEGRAKFLRDLGLSAADMAATAAESAAGAAAGVGTHTQYRTSRNARWISPSAAFPAGLSLPYASRTAIF